VPRTTELPSVADLAGPLLAAVAPEQRPLFVALAERIAAERYRSWAAAAQEPGDRAQLLACAEREEEIAGRIEALHPEAEAVQADLLARHPELAEVNRTLFADRPLADQFTIQAGGERVGASTWRALADQAGGEAREVYLACAELEERSAEVLESILAKG
jgi:hypothetical protein